MMAARAWPLGKRSGWRENRHDHLKGRARALTRPSPACRYLPVMIKMTLPTPCRMLSLGQQSAGSAVASLPGLSCDVRRSWECFLAAEC